MIHRDDTITSFVAVCCVPIDLIGDNSLDSARDIASLSGTTTNTLILEAGLLMPCHSRTD